MQCSYSNYNLDITTYHEAVKNFEWPTQIQPISNPFALHCFSRNISHRIDHAYLCKLQTLVCSNMTLVDACYATIQEVDDNKSILNKIKTASDQERTMLTQVVHLLSQGYILLHLDILKEMTLLFGMHVLANPRLNLSAPDLEKIDETQKELASLKQQAAQIKNNEVLAEVTANSFFNQFMSRIIPIEEELAITLFGTKIKLQPNEVI